MHIKRFLNSIDAVPRSVPTVALGLIAIFYGTAATADCRDQIEELDRSYSSAGYMLSDSNATTTSGYLAQSRSLRDTALIMLSNDREDECANLINEAQRLADKASMPSVFSASELIGKEVLDRNGESIGNVEDVMVDLDRGVVAYALVAFGGFLGFGEDLIPVPFGKFSQNPGSDALELASSVKKLENAPRFIEGEWNLMSRRSWSTEVYNYYGEDPYWVEQRTKNAQKPSRDVANMGVRAAQPGEPAGAGASPEDESHLADVAKHDPIKSFDDLFTILDTDEDGAVSQEEARREFVVMKRFSELDGDGNSELTSEEFAVLRATNEVSADGQTLIPKTEDAQPEESWTGGKIKKEAVQD